jgi:hypothetical protein
MESRRAGFPQRSGGSFSSGQPCCITELVATAATGLGIFAAVASSVEDETPTNWNLVPAAGLESARVRLQSGCSPSELYGLGRFICSRTFGLREQGTAARK